MGSTTPVAAAVAELRLIIIEVTAEEPVAVAEHMPAETSFIQDGTDKKTPVAVAVAKAMRHKRGAKAMAAQASLSSVGAIRNGRWLNGIKTKEGLCVYL